MDYPSIKDVLQAGHEELARWYRFLPSPGSQYLGHPCFPEKQEEEQHIMECIMRKLKEAGGITPEVSKRVGWNKSIKALLLL